MDDNAFAIQEKWVAFRNCFVIHGFPSPNTNRITIEKMNKFSHYSSASYQDLVADVRSPLITLVLNSGATQIALTTFASSCKFSDFIALINLFFYLFLTIWWYCSWGPWLGPGSIRYISRVHWLRGEDRPTGDARGEGNCWIRVKTENKEKTSNCVEIHFNSLQTFRSSLYATVTDYKLASDEWVARHLNIFVSHNRLLENTRKKHSMLNLRPQLHNYCFFRVVTVELSSDLNVDDAHAVSIVADGQEPIRWAVKYPLQFIIHYLQIVSTENDQVLQLVRCQHGSSRFERKGWILTNISPKLKKNIQELTVSWTRNDADLNKYFMVRVQPSLDAKKTTTAEPEHTTTLEPEPADRTTTGEPEPEDQSTTEPEPAVRTTTMEPEPDQTTTVEDEPVQTTTEAEQTTTMEQEDTTTKEPEKTTTEPIMTSTREPTTTDVPESIVTTTEEPEKTAPIKTTTPYKRHSTPPPVRTT